MPIGIIAYENLNAIFLSFKNKISFSSIFPQRKNRNAYTFRFPVERETGFEPATPTLARLYSTPEPLAHLLIFILLSARCTLQMILYRNSPHLSIPIFNFFQKKSKVSTIPSIFALHQTPAQLSSPHKFTPNHPPDESRLLSIRPPNPTCSRRSASWRIQTLYPRPHRQTSRGFVPAVQRARSSEVVRGRPYSPLRLQNRAQHILII